MPTINITIPKPIVSGSEFFRVRWRSYPSGSFSAPQNETNAPFSIVVPSPGDYEIEIVLVKSDDLECPATYRYVTVAPDFTCLDISRERIEKPAGSRIFYERITFQVGTQPPCGWRIQVGASTKVYTTLPPSNQIEYPTSNIVQRVIITALLCNGNEKICFDALTTPIPDPPSPCTPVVAVEGEIILTDTPQGFWYNIHFYFNQSTPATRNAHFLYQQIGTPVSAGQPLDNGSYIFPNTLFLSSNKAGSNSKQIIKVNPVPTVGPITYIVRMLDDCGQWHQLTITI